MAKAPSEATQLRTAKRRINELEALVSQARSEGTGWRQRATKAEQEAAEWKARFDILLRREPASTKGSEPPADIPDGGKGVER